MPEVVSTRSFGRDMRSSIATAPYNPGMFTTVARTGEGVRLLDQRRLPGATEYVTLTTAEQTAEASRAVVVRRAQARGVTAPVGLASVATNASAGTLEAELVRADRVLRAARPTAVNLAWALDRMMAVAERARREGAEDVAIAARLEREARAIHDEDLEACRAIGRFGATLVPERASILTHCNAGGP